MAAGFILTTTAEAFLTGCVNMGCDQPLIFEEMIAPRIGDCKGFDKFDQSRIYVTLAYATPCTVKIFARLRTLHCSKMLHPTQKRQWMLNIDRTLGYN